jgi:hypothetical protein
MFYPRPEWEVKWAPDQVWTLWRGNKPLGYSGPAARSLVATLMTLDWEELSEYNCFVDVLSRATSLNLNHQRAHEFPSKACYQGNTTCKFSCFLSIYLSIYLSVALQPLGPWPLFQFLNLYTVGRTPWTGDQSVARPLPIYRTTQTRNKRTQTSMPWMGFEPTIPVFERAKTVHALDRVATVIGLLLGVPHVPVVVHVSHWGTHC